MLSKNKFRALKRSHPDAFPKRDERDPEVKQSRALSRTARFVQVVLLAPLRATGNEQRDAENEAFVRRIISAQVNGLGGVHPDGGHIQIHATDEAVKLLQPVLRRKKISGVGYDDKRSETVVAAVRHEAVESPRRNDGMALLKMVERVVG